MVRQRSISQVYKNIIMVIEKDVYFLKAEKFEFVGKDGQNVIAFNCRVVIDGVVFKCKLSKEVYEDVKDVVEEKGKASLEFSASKEVPYVRLNSFTW